MHVMSESYKSRTLGNVIGEFMQAHGNACISLGRWVLFCLHMRRVLSHKAGSFTFKWHAETPTKQIYTKIIHFEGPENTLCAFVRPIPEQGVYLMQITIYI